MQFFGQGKPSVGVVFDSDMGTGVDDALALAALYGLQTKGESRVVGITSSKPNFKSAVFCDVMWRFYQGEPAGGFSGFVPPVSIGIPVKGARPEDTPMLSVVDLKTPEGKPVHARGLAKMNDTADPLAVIRNALSGQYDQNAIVVLAGPATNLANALAMPDMKAWIQSKVRYLVVAAGAYPGGATESGIQGDIPAARRLFAEWPGQIVAVGSEIGAAVPFPGSSIEKDFAWAPVHPVVDAYRAIRPMPYDAPATALAAALYAVRPKENYFKVSDPGGITVADSGVTQFTASASGRHRYLIADPAQKEKLIAAYVELASAKPGPRPQRFRPPAKQDVQKQDVQKQDAPKQEPAKKQ